MMLLLAIGVGLVLAAGAWLALSRDILRCLIGLSVIGSGANLLVHAAGRPGANVPAIIAAGQTQLVEAANPLTQALVLTAIVIGFALLCFGLALAARLVEDTGSSDMSRLDAVEPAAGTDGKPAVDDGP